MFKIQCNYERNMNSIPFLLPFFREILFFFLFLFCAERKWTRTDATIISMTRTSSLFSSPHSSLFIAHSIEGISPSSKWLWVTLYAYYQCWVFVFCNGRLHIFFPKLPWQKGNIWIVLSCFYNYIFIPIISALSKWRYYFE